MRFLLRLLCLSSNAGLGSFHRAEHGIRAICTDPERQRTEPRICLGAEVGGGKRCLAGVWVNGLFDLPPT